MDTERILSLIPEIFVSISRFPEKMPISSPSNRIRLLFTKTNILIDVKIGVILRAYSIYILECKYNSTKMTNIMSDTSIDIVRKLSTLQ